MTNYFHFEFDISPHYILSKFTRLETLILEDIDWKYVKNILNDISFLFNLSTLILIPNGCVKDRNLYLLQILRLSALKYCKVLFYSLCESDPLPFATNQYAMTEHFVIKHGIQTGELVRLLSYVPQLRRLSIDYPFKLDKNELNHRITLKYLTHLSIKENDLSFDDFELLIKSLFRTIQVLHIHVINGEEYIDANRWERLILYSMPFLRVFDIYISGRSYLPCELRFHGFNSSFWLERKWHFDHEEYFNHNYYEFTFYSINPYRYD